MEKAEEQEGAVWSGGGLQLWDGGVVAAGAGAVCAIGGGAAGSMSGLSPCRHASTCSVGEDRNSMSRRIETGCSVTRRVQVESRCGFETRCEECLSPSQLVAAQGQSMGFQGDAALESSCLRASKIRRGGSKAWRRPRDGSRDVEQRRK